MHVGGTREVTGDVDRAPPPLQGTRPHRELPAEEILRASMICISGSILLFRCLHAFLLGVWLSLCSLAVAHSLNTTASLSSLLGMGGVPPGHGGHAEAPALARKQRQSCKALGRGHANGEQMLPSGLRSCLGTTGATCLESIRQPIKGAEA